MAKLKKNKKPNKNILNILFVFIGILFLGVTIYSIVQKPLSSEEGKELKWCENCQTYH